MSENMSEITILHLSDIHFKKKEKEDNKALRQTVQERLIEAVATHNQEHGRLDVVAVTGDIAFSGKKHEYKEAADFFKELKKVLPEEIEFLPVPGNHDVDRDVLDKFSPPYYVVKNNMVDKFLEQPAQIKQKVNVKFKAFRSFARHLNSLSYQKPADYFWVRNIEDRGISFLGLNSAWASEGDNDHSNIALGFSQVREALEKAKEIPNRILLMHHPPFNWLKDLEYGKTQVEMFRHCRLLLHGHAHSDNAMIYKDPSNQCICLGANASYAGDKEGFIGFQFVDVQYINKGINDKGIKVTVWPYKWEAQRNDFVPHRERWSSQGGKAYFVIEAVESAQESKPGDAVSLVFPEEYGNWLAEFHSVLPMDQLARKGEAVLISLPAVYIPLETSNPFHRPVDEREMKKGSEKEPKEPAAIDIEALMGRVNCLVLRGKAGMGKTTLIKHLAYSLAHGTGPASLRGYLPIMVFLKDLGPIYEEKIKEQPGKVTFEMLLGVYVEEYRCKHRCPLTMKTIQGFLAHNRALMLLDGLDEVPGEIRDDLVDLVHGFQYAHKTNRFLITGRPHGIEGRGMVRFGKHVRDIEPLGEKESRDFISRWFRAVSGQAAGFGDANAADMITDIREHEHAAIFTENPLLLTALCIFYLVGGKRIPDQRADLYDRIVGNLLYRRFHDPADREKVNRVREFLMLLAFSMHERNTRSIDAGEAAGFLEQTCPRRHDEPVPDYRKRLGVLFNAIEPMCGLLNRVDSGDIEFAHLSFQEFLAANHMLDRDIDYKKYREDPWWKEAVLLYAGLMNLALKKRSNDMVYDMLDKKAPLRIQLLGAEALRDFQASKREEAAVQKANDRLLAIIQSDAGLQDRFNAGEILGNLGDPRINILEPPMIEIPAGEFTRGSDDDDSYDDEKPVRRIYLDAFEIGKYPITNHEFKSFVDDKGYGNQGFWTPESWQWRKEKNISEPGFWHDRKWNGPNFPVVGVSWYEASAYAKWLSARTGHRYVLPTEAQWEKAARGSGGFLYPWGKEWQADRCNSYECKLGGTSPVGIFPAGASPRGCLDMAGNVWEWCADWGDGDYYKKSPDRTPPGPGDGSSRVVRGGGWVGNRRRCRVSYRDWARPGSRDADSGFRLVRLL
jgi:formylglycine-generating enzyme required for sulfatase activity/predicted MPP superfamily phosphohydrolase